jgi:hypothetical protein
MIKEVLRGNKEVVYGEDVDEDCIHVSAFRCLAPLNYIERGRSRCPHEHRCREEGLLLALLDGKKVLDYSKTRVIEFPRRRKSKKTREAA